MNAKQIKEAILKHVDCTYGDPEDKRKYYAEIVSLLDQYKHENVKKALSVAVTTIYADDSSDYVRALWGIVQELGGNEVVNLLSENEHEAYKRYSLDHKEA